MNTATFTNLVRTSALRSWMAALTILPCIVGAQSSPASESRSQDFALTNAQVTEIWVDDVGSGFRPGVQSIGFSLGGYHGLAKCGSHEAHQMALTSLTYGHMLGRTKGADCWYRGNWEFRLELFGGLQFNPDTDWIVGLTPHFRYNFATGTRWVPYLDLGAGASGTGIGLPDLGSTFQFNEQAGVGVHYFITSNIALSFESLYMHISDAGISKPNCGVNGVKSLIGLSFFF